MSAVRSSRCQLCSVPAVKFCTTSAVSLAAVLCDTCRARACAERPLHTGEGAASCCVHTSWTRQCKVQDANSVPCLECSSVRPAPYHWPSGAMRDVPWAIVRRAPVGHRDGAASCGVHTPWTCSATHRVCASDVRVPAASTQSGAHERVTTQHKQLHSQKMTLQKGSWKPRQKVSHGASSTG